MFILLNTLPKSTLDRDDPFPGAELQALRFVLVHLGDLNLPKLPKLLNVEIIFSHQGQGLGQVWGSHGVEYIGCLL